MTTPLLRDDRLPGGAVKRSVRDDIVDKLEENFVDLAFGLGKIEGMRPEQIHAYFRYVADWRLTKLT
ncbi:hypothetical protein [Bradyrhizobium jicamae]|uniref:hypothetical protein n=1 Tax=Bradyrhizobium jicamae TaxID=280332 RepID=UPI000A5FA871|nr:hypothetical protein [Bradyrhizobium jicamae]